MNGFRLCLSAGLILAGIGSARAQTPADSPAAPSVATLEALVSDYVRLRSELAVEKQAWAEQEARWRRETALLETERRQLLEERERLTERTAQRERARQEQADRNAVLERTFEALPPLLDDAEARLRVWRRRLPPALAAPLEQAFRELPDDPAAARREDTLRRLQRVMALYAQIEQIQTRTHGVKERLPVSETARREVDVLYLGLARGFAVSADNAWAATGHPGDDGWNWTPDPALAPAIRRALDTFHRQTTAQFVSLPMRLLEPDPSAVRDPADSGERSNDETEARP